MIKRRNLHLILILFTTTLFGGSGHAEELEPNQFPLVFDGEKIIIGSETTSEAILNFATHAFRFEPEMRSNFGIFLRGHSSGADKVGDRLVVPPT